MEGPHESLRGAQGSGGSPQQISPLGSGATPSCTQSADDLISGVVRSDLTCTSLARRHQYLGLPRACAGRCEIEQMWAMHDHMIAHSLKSV